MTSKQRGMTLIELVVVFAIVAILSALAVSLYKHYMKKSTVAEGVIMFSFFRTAVETFYFEMDNYPASLNSLSHIPTQGNHVTGMNYNPGPPMRNEICFEGFAAGQNCIEWIWHDVPPQAYWTCKPSETNTTLESRYLPKNCQE